MKGSLQVIYCYWVEEICHFSSGRSICGKAVPKVYMHGPLVRRPRDITETKGTVVPNADRPKPTRNVFIFDNGVALKGPKMS